jgi:hypothetical protein
MADHEVFLCLRINTKCSWCNLVMFFKRNLNYIRLYLNKGKNGISMVILMNGGF